MDRKLVLGAVQYRFVPEPGTEYVTVCHHPPDWLFDKDSADDAIRIYGRVQIFGHKHRPRAYIVGNGIRLAAGATHPDRGERDWKPAYNVVGIEIEGTGAKRKMRVDVYGRMWEDGSHSFQPMVSHNGEDKETFRFDLSAWTPPAHAEPDSITVQTSPDISVVRIEGHGAEILMNPARMLMYRFLTLPYVSKIDVAKTLGLMSNEDAGLADSELYLRYYARAKDKGRLPEFWEAVEKAHGVENSPNPFKE